jgi:hypothetical protein
VAVKIHFLAVAFRALASAAHAGGPFHAREVDTTGWWECDRGFVIQARPGGLCASLRAKSCKA